MGSISRCPSWTEISSAAGSDRILLAWHGEGTQYWGWIYHSREEGGCKKSISITQSKLILNLVKKRIHIYTRTVNTFLREKSNSKPPYRLNLRCSLRALSVTLGLTGDLVSNGFSPRRIRWVLGFTWKLVMGSIKGRGEELHKREQLTHIS